MFTKKTLYRRFAFQKVTARKNSQNLADITCVGVSFFAKLQNTKIYNTLKKTHVPDPMF